VICGIKELKLSQVVRTSSGAILDLPYCVYYNLKDLVNELSQKEFYLLGQMLKGRILKISLLTK